MIDRIEIDFATPVELTEAEAFQLHQLVRFIAERHQPPGCVHWLSEHGHKMNLQCQADQEFLGKPIDLSLPRGPVEPTFDDTILYFGTCVRPR